MLGVDRVLLAANFAITWIMITSFMAFWFLIITYILHRVCKYLCKSEPHIGRITVAWLKEENRYDPWAHPNHTTGRRPAGFGPEFQ